MFLNRSICCSANTHSMILQICQESFSYSCAFSSNLLFSCSCCSLLILFILESSDSFPEFIFASSSSRSFTFDKALWRTDSYSSRCFRISVKFSSSRSSSLISQLVISRPLRLDLFFMALSVSMMPLSFALRNHNFSLESVYSAMHFYSKSGKNV